MQNHPGRYGKEKIEVKIGNSEDDFLFFFCIFFVIVGSGDGNAQIILDTWIFR